MDQSYPTASFTDTSPLLLILGCWGLVTAFRPRGIGLVRLTRIIVFGAAVGAGGVLLWGYISQRYLGDLMPFFIITSGIGLIDIWRRLEGRLPRFRGFALGGMITIGAYCITANLAVAVVPGFPMDLRPECSVHQCREGAQHRLPRRLRAARIDTALLGAGRADLRYGQLLWSLPLDGQLLKDVPGQQIEHYTWMPVEQSPSFSASSASPSIVR